jgi:hypothetical protein
MTLPRALGLIAFALLAAPAHANVTATLSDGKLKLVGDGAADVLDVGPGPASDEVVVTAFNGRLVNGAPTATFIAVSKLVAELKDGDDVEGARLRAARPLRDLRAAVPDGRVTGLGARRLRNTPGKTDGLYWDADLAKGEELSPIGPLLRDATGRSAGEPYHGYYFKILTRQGPAAPAGAYDYVINGRMIGGFAAVAFPAEHGSTGLKTFIVNHYDVVYEIDLGPGTSRIAAAMNEYDPESSWKPVQE